MVALSMDDVFVMLCGELQRQPRGGEVEMARGQRGGERGGFGGFGGGRGGLVTNCVLIFFSYIGEDS